VQRNLFLDDELDCKSLPDFIKALEDIYRSRAKGNESCVEFMEFGLTIAYQDYETDDEEAKREAEEAREKHKRHVQYLKLKEEFEPEK
jgi:hypothetical protein